MTLSTHQIERLRELRKKMDRCRITDPIEVYDFIELLGILTTGDAAEGEDYDRSIHMDPDALHWAQFFIATCKKIGKPLGDEDTDWMQSWFANAMMAMHDFIKSKERAKESPTPSAGDKLPRRCCMDKWCDAEKAIFTAAQVVESMAAHPLLTKAVCLLSDARNAVADYIDSVEPPKHSDKSAGEAKE